MTTAVASGSSGDGVEGEVGRDRIEQQSVEGGFLFPPEAETFHGDGESGAGGKFFVTTGIKERVGISKGCLNSSDGAVSGIETRGSASGIGREDPLCPESLSTHQQSAMTTPSKSPTLSAVLYLSAFALVGGIFMFSGCRSGAEPPESRPVSAPTWSPSAPIPSARSEGSGTAEPQGSGSSAPAPATRPAPPAAPQGSGYSTPQGSGSSAPQGSGYR